MAKDDPRTTAGELQKIVLISGSEQYLHVVGMVSRKIILAHPKTNSSIFSYHTLLASMAR